MSDSNDFNSNASVSASVTGEIMVAMIIIVFMLFIAAFILYLRAKGYSGTIGLARSQSHHPVFAPNQPSILKQPLDPSNLNSLHFTLFRSGDFKEGGLECAVCLSELRDGEKVRLLPKCKHGFHIECIDMWFQSNSTCPLCRNTVGADNNITPFEEVPIQSLEVVSESQNSSTSFEEGNSSSGGSFSEKRQKVMLVVEIPRQAMEGFSSTSNTPLPSSRMPAEGIKSPALETLRSMRRILSRGSLNGNFSASFCSPRGGDIEQGTATATVIQEEFRICQLSLVK